MQRILIVKTSSLGDVVHNLPVASDLAAALPGAVVDWVVEESFAAIPALHPAVHRTIPVALRRWRKSWWSAAAHNGIGAFLRELRLESYDAVIDTQGLLKSALVTRAANGTRYGLDWRSSREPLALFYDRTFHVPRTQQAVERNRKLVAQALGYAAGDKVSYGIAAVRETFSWQPADPYAVLIHATSAAKKLWAEAQWIALGTALGKRGIRAVLPWGSAQERERSERLNRAIPGSVVPPRLNLDHMGSLLAQAACAVGVDTGLTHLAGALGVGTVGLYIATDPALTGLYGCAQAVNLGGVGRAPQVTDVLREVERYT
jgi:heptosyltransferase-1